MVDVHDDERRLSQRALPSDRPSQIKRLHWKKKKRKKKKKGKKIQKKGKKTKQNKKSTPPDPTATFKPPHGSRPAGASVPQ